MSKKHPRIPRAWEPWLLIVREGEGYEASMKTLGLHPAYQELCALALSAAKWHPGRGSFYRGTGECGCCCLVMGCGECILDKDRTGSYCDEGTTDEVFARIMAAYRVAYDRWARIAPALGYKRKDWAAR